MINTDSLRTKAIDLAIQGKLTKQLPEDGTADELLTQITAEKKKESRRALVREKRICLRYQQTKKYLRFLIAGSGADLEMFLMFQWDNHLRVKI